MGVEHIFVTTLVIVDGGFHQVGSTGAVGLALPKGANQFPSLPNVSGWGFVCIHFQILVIIRWCSRLLLIFHANSNAKCFAVRSLNCKVLCSQCTAIGALEDGPLCLASWAG